MKKIIKDTVILTVITLIAGLLLGFFYNLTKEPIEKQQALAKEKACMAVFEMADKFSEPLNLDGVNEKIAQAAEGNETIGNAEIDEAVEALDGSGKVIGYVITVISHEGYGGDIKFTMGVASDGTVNGISILSIKETAGLGMKANTDEFKAQYEKKQAESFEVVKGSVSSDNQIQAISGATITSKAVTYGVNAGLCYFQMVTGGAGNE